MSEKSNTINEPSGKEFEISREFNAPREVVFNLLTKAEHLKHWWGPKELKMGTTKVDLRPGGMFHYSMIAPDGTEMWGRFIYHEIIPPEKIVFVNSFSDERGGITRHPMAPKWPAEVMNILTLTEHNGKTTLTLRGGPINATAEERKIFEDGFSSMQHGFTGTFDQLDEYLSNL